MVCKRLAFFFGALLLVLAAACPIPASGVSTSARGAALLDAGSGRFLYEQNADERLPMASTTKIMTALVVTEHAVVDDTVTVSKEAVGIIGSSMYLREGEQLTVEDLLYGLLLLSGNDAATALAIHCAGSEEAFVALMNAKAADLNLTDTRFSNPHGLDADGHYTTARELAVIASEALRDPVIAAIAATKTTTAAGRHMTNHNKMLRLYEGANGLKTGFTTNARRCLVSSATRDGQTLIAVTLNDGDDWADHRALLDYGFSKYPRRVFAEQGRVITTIPVVGGVWPSVELTAEQTLAYPLSDTEYETAAVSVEAPRFVYAGVTQDKDAGSLILQRDGREIARVNLVYDRTVAQDEPVKPSLWRRIADFFQSLSFSSHNMR